MNVFLLGRNFENLSRELTKKNIRVVDNPQQADLLITHGGDGAFLCADHQYPDMVKFPIRDAETAPLCPIHKLENQIDALLSGRLNHTFLPRMCGSFQGKNIYALNDIFIHNENNVMAMRYKVWIDSELYGHEIVGDGVGLSTIHGSTAYYRSITHSTFRTGIGLAFSNSTELVNHIVLPETSVVTVKILRGPCLMVADNSPEQVRMVAEEEAKIHLSKQVCSVLGLDFFMCPECRILRHSLRNSTQYA